MKWNKPMRSLFASVFVFGVLCGCQPSFAQQPNNIDPVAVVRRATQNEIAATGPTKAPFFMYKDTHAIQRSLHHHRGH